MGFATASASNIDAIKWLMKQNPPYKVIHDELVLVDMNVATRGDLDTLKWMRSSGMYENVA